MSRVLNYVPRAAFFLAGVAIAAVTLPKRQSNGATAPTADDLKTAIGDLEARLQARLQARETADEARFSQVELRLEEHADRLKDLPSTSQIVAAMEQQLSRTMATLDDRLTAQAHSIDVLKATVSQTDSLLERVLESLDSLQTFTEPADSADDSLLTQPRM